MSDIFSKRFNFDDSLAVKTGFNPYYQRITESKKGKFKINGEDFLDLASNNYLGLADDENVKTAMKNAIDKYGSSLCGTPIATGYIELFEKVKLDLENFLELESILILPSCYQANNGLFSAISNKNDLILFDHYAHSSLVQGIKSSEAKIRPFLHNNSNSLRKILENSYKKYEQIFIVTESVFSTEGSIAPIDEFTELGNDFNAILVIDDSHGIGVLGEKGEGILKHFNIKNFQGIYTASLGKALANSGGIIAGNGRIMQYLQYYCPHLIYSTAITPSSLAGIEKVLDILKSRGKEIIEKLYKNKFKIEKVLKESGRDIVDSSAPIISINSGNDEDTFFLAKAFYNKRILTTPFIYPSVPKNDGKLRLIPNAGLDKKDIEYILHSIKEIGNDTK